MDNIGAEVGQKMRSAVKAKLMELGCYVDDELPDYIMVMVANKRTKSQMNQDLDLFLNTKTSTFVDWLHIVLKKLEEITVTNPTVLKKISKHKSGSNVKIKKEKKSKVKTGKKTKKKENPPANIKVESKPLKSLTDDLPLKANKLSDVRKIVIMKDTNGTSCNSAEANVVEDNFDIPSLSEVANENELADIQKKIKCVKDRLGIQVASESDDEDYINLKADPEDLFAADVAVQEQKLKEQILHKISLLDSASSNNNLTIPSRTTLNKEVSLSSGKRPSILERLGKKQDSSTSDSNLKRKSYKLSELSKEGEILNKLSKTVDCTEDNNYEGTNKRLKTTEAPRESALKRLGLMSKVAIPQKEMESTNEDAALELLAKDVQSSVKVKPRQLLPSSKQANKKLLLKAVAEAHRSVAQTPVVGSSKHDAIYTKKYREKMNNLQTRKISVKDKSTIQNIIVTAGKPVKKDIGYSSDDDLEYIPKPIKRTAKVIDHPEYIPSSRSHSSDEGEMAETSSINSGINSDSSFPKRSKNQTFIITLDGISRTPDLKSSASNKNSETCENRKRNVPSPIVFDSQTSPIVTKGKPVPDKLPVVTSPTSVKTKERCKFWPACRQGEKCEFIHPNTLCKAFPQCKFGDKCLYVHPTCKFEMSCTRKECPYSHTSYSSGKTQPMCRFYPNCSNIHCSFYHPKPCKYGINCKNPHQCTFSHTFPSKSSLTWRSTVK